MSYIAEYQFLSSITWLLALTEFVLAGYVLALNARHFANRHVAGLFLLFAVDNFALGLQFDALDVVQGNLAAALLAATVPAVGPALFVVTVALLKPEWLRGPRRWLMWPFYGLIFLPMLLTVLDVTRGTQIWYVGLDPQTYMGGHVPLEAYTSESFPTFLKMLMIQGMPLLTLIPIIYVQLRASREKPMTVRLAWVLLGAQILAIVVQITLRSILPPGVATLIAGANFVLAYGYAAFRQMVSERRLQRGRLQRRLTAVILVITLPLMLTLVAFVGMSVLRPLRQDARDQLETANMSLTTHISTWLDFNDRALQQLLFQPAIISMDPEQQKPLLEDMAATYPYMYLVSTTDLTGINVARNDEVAPKDYSDRPWFLNARNGKRWTQILVGRTSGQPALVMSRPIYDETGQIVGVGMFASTLLDLTREVESNVVGENGVAYVVNDQDLLVMHSNPGLFDVLRDLGLAPAVSALRAGEGGLVTFTDEEGQEWWAYTSKLENGWGIVVETPSSELMRPFLVVRDLSLLGVGFGVVLLIVLSSLAIRQAFQPVRALTETVQKISAGDLARQAEIVSEDEIGVLARTFNAMTARLQETIGSLESQVEVRTQDLERRASYLEASAEIGRAASSILESERLIDQMVSLIAQRFRLYYVGLFLVDETGEWAVLRAGTGEAGQIMLSRGHRLRVGPGSMIGWSIANSQSRVALEAGKDAERLATPELPETRSEAAIPLRSRGRVLGALTVQDTEAGAFDEIAISALQTMADQVAVALDNARLLAEAQGALETARRAYGELSREAWSVLLEERGAWGYRYAGGTVTRTAGEPGSERSATGLSMPIEIRGEVVGTIHCRKDGDEEVWTQEEQELLQILAERLEQALESARLFQDVQRRASEERLVGEMTTRLRESLDVDVVLQTAVREFRDLLDLQSAEVRIAPSGSNGHDDKEGA